MSFLLHRRWPYLEHQRDVVERDVPNVLAHAVAGHLNNVSTK
jgi:hypothetical protein